MLAYLLTVYYGPRVHVYVVVFFDATDSYHMCQIASQVKRVVGDSF